MWYCLLYAVVLTSKFVDETLDGSHSSKVAFNQQKGSSGLFPTDLKMHQSHHSHCQMQMKLHLPRRIEAAEGREKSSKLVSI